MLTHEEGMRLALEEAGRAATENEVPVGAVLAKNGTVIAAAHNTCRRDNDPTRHAEMQALQQGVRQLGSLRDCTLYVTLEPCAMCAGACVHTNLGELVFGAFDEKEGFCGSLLDLTDHWLGWSVKTTGGILEKECAALLSAFFQNRR